jgi:hypothetical protein
MPEGHEECPLTIPMRVLKKSSFSNPDPFVDLIRQHVIFNRSLDAVRKTDFH